MMCAALSVGNLFLEQQDHYVLLFCVIFSNRATLSGVVSAISCDVFYFLKGAVLAAVL